MGAAWVAGSVRARLLLEHRAGTETARLVAGAGSLDERRGAPLRNGRTSRSRVARRLEAAQRAVAASLALQIRLLAAWLPRTRPHGLRALAAWFELVNIEDRLAYLARCRARARRTSSACSLRSGTAAAAAAEPRRAAARARRARAGATQAATTPHDIHLALRLAWARRVSTQVPEARHWAAGAVAILLAGGAVRRRTAARRRSRAPRAARPGLGRRGVDRGSARAAAPRLRPGRSTGVDDPAELWRAELAWWRHGGSRTRSAMTRGRLEGATSCSALSRCSRSTRCVLTSALAVGRAGRRAASARRSSMPSADLVLPERMSRVAVVAPRPGARDALVELARSRHRRARRQSAAAGGRGSRGAAAAPRRTGRCRGDRAGRCSTGEPDVAALERAGESGLLAGRGRARPACPARGLARQLPAWVGWAPTASSPPLNERLAGDRRRSRRAASARLGRAADAPQPGQRWSSRSGRSSRATGRPATATWTPRRSRSSPSSSCSGSCSATSVTAWCSCCSRSVAAPPHERPLRGASGTFG